MQTIAFLTKKGYGETDGCFCPFCDNFESVHFNGWEYCNEIPVNCQKCQAFFVIDRKVDNPNEEDPYFDFSRLEKLPDFTTSPKFTSLATEFPYEYGNIQLYLDNSDTDDDDYGFYLVDLLFIDRVINDDLAMFRYQSDDTPRLPDERINEFIDHVMNDSLRMTLEERRKFNKDQHIRDLMAQYSLRETTDDDREETPDFSLSLPCRSFNMRTPKIPYPERYDYFERGYLLCTDNDGNEITVELIGD